MYSTMPDLFLSCDAHGRILIFTTRLQDVKHLIATILAPIMSAHRSEGWESLELSDVFGGPNRGGISPEVTFFRDVSIS